MIKFMVLCTQNNEERENNVKLMKEKIPQLHIRTSGIDGLFENFMSCFELEEEYTGMVFLEDDVMLCKNFVKVVTDIITNRNDKVISFFESPLSKKELHSEYRAGRYFAYTVCNYFDAEICKEIATKNNFIEFKNWYFKHYKTWTYPCDIYIAWILKTMGVKYYMHIPFPVQHLNFKSALGNRSTKRQTKYFIDDTVVSDE